MTCELQLKHGVLLFDEDDENLVLSRTWGSVVRGSELVYARTTLSRKVTGPKQVLVYLHFPETVNFEC
jgi:hypothetical protein